MRRLLRIAVLLVAIAGVAAAGGSWWLSRQLAAPGPAAQDIQLVLPRGAGQRAIATQLEQAGAVRDARLFSAGVWLEDAAGALRAGEYRIPAGSSVRAVIALLRSGRTVVRRLTVPEGLTVAQVLALLREAEGLAGDIGPPPSEGTLLPETYHYSWGDSRAALLARMGRAMDETLAELWVARAAELHYRTPGEAVVLASIVERETAVGGERPLVAGVFLNRLRRGMRLQSDPTVIYGLTQGQSALDRPLSRADLEAEHDWNTYRNAGLPPTPIANPGRAALLAALDPQPSRYLYFVADGSGGHAFAETLEEHNRNVRAWRRLQR